METKNYKDVIVVKTKLELLFDGVIDENDLRYHLVLLHKIFLLSPPLLDFAKIIWWTKDYDFYKQKCRIL